MRFGRFLGIGLVALLLPLPSFAGLCDFRLSEVISKRGPALAAPAIDPVLMRALGADERDFFTLVDGQSGLSALGAVLAVSGQAQALGALQGAVQLVGTGGTVLSGPAIGMAAGAAVLGMGGLEGLCRFKDERITDYYEVLAVLYAVNETADPKYFQLQLGPARKKAAVAEIWNAKTQLREQFKVSDLQFVNGELVLSRWGPNRSLGYLMQFENPSAEFGPAKSP